MTATRRQFGRNLLGGLAAGALYGGCGDNRAHDDGDAAGGDGGGDACTVYPQETEGPYYLDLDTLRRDLTEGKPGAPLTLTLTVIGKSGATCAALAGIPVDLWHCDAAGVYSGFPGQLGGLDTTGMTFLRGTQVTDGDGKVTFTTIYPGWYPGRTTHIHFKVHTSATMAATSQMYFDEGVTAAVYAQGAYASHGAKDTTNLRDVAVAGTLPPLVATSGDAVGGFAATLTIAVAGS